MFLGILNGLKQTIPNTQNQSLIDGFTYYLERYIELDGDDHGPLSLKIVEAVCDGGNTNTSSSSSDDDDVLWSHTKDAAIDALEERIKLWDGVVNELVL